MSKDAGSSTARPSREFTFRYPLRHGLHARPANRLVEVTQQFASKIILTNQRTKSAADAKSLLALVALDIAESDECGVRISGDDAEAALEGLRTFLRDVLPICDDLPPASLTRTDLPDAHALRDAAFPIHTGTRIHGGVARGAVVVPSGFCLPPELALEPAASAAEERQRLQHACSAVRRDLQRRRTASTQATERDILDAHLTIVGDCAFIEELERLIAAGQSAGSAVVGAGQHFSGILRAAASALTRERSADVRDICEQILGQIYGTRLQNVQASLREPSIVVAEDITPSQLLGLDKRFLKGLILEQSGPTSHAMILAASFDIPTLTDVDNACAELAHAPELILDAHCGVAIPAGDPQAEAYYERVSRREQRRHEQLARFADRECRTSDGVRLGVSANISTVAEVAQAVRHGCDGIGLFRTELLFMDRDAPPSEEEQVAMYTEAARTADGRPVTIRTVDIGGDKPLPYLDLGPEDNPFLGYRGVRLYAEHAELFRGQVRAILRASAFGSLKLMLPMVSTLEEVTWFRSQLAELQDELTAAGCDFDRKMPIGIMVEVPSAAFLIGAFARHVDFFSIGTNDLAQYFFAADRGNPRVSALCETSQPAFLRLLQQIISKSHQHQRPVSMCGEMARDVRNLPLLIGLGLDEVSVARSEMVRLKATTQRLSAGDCRATAQAMLAGEQGPEAAGTPGAVLAMSEPGLMISDGQADSKEAAIAELVDALYVTARTDAPGTTEAAIWAREETCSTAVGHGFAIPHCKSDAVTASSFAVLQLAQPIQWDAAGTLVQYVVLLAIRESDTDRTHMKVLARLARSLMRDTFRDAVQAAPNSAALLECLFEELDLES